MVEPSVGALDESTLTYELLAAFAAMAFLVACAWAATPSEAKDILKTHADRAIAEVNTEIKAKQ